MSATFKGKVALDELDPPQRCVLKGEGQGGVAGFAKGEAEVLLTPEDGGTALTYTAKANVGGKLAQIGQRLIDGAARQIADDFFAHSQRPSARPGVRRSGGANAEAIALGESEAAGVPMEPIATGAAIPHGPAGGAALRGTAWPRKSGSSGLIAVIVILLILFGVVL